MKIDFFGFKIDYLTIFGLTAQFLFFLRFIYQWIISEKKKESIIPIQFWYFSILGGILITIYAFLRRDLVFFLGQLFALFIYIRNLALIDKKRTVHEKKYKTVNPLKKYFIFSFLRDIKKIIKNVGAKNILDIGCGEGQVINSLRKNNKDLKFTGIDISEKSIKNAKKNIKGVEFLISDIYKIDKLFKNSSFNLVLTLEVLEHLYDPKLALEKLKKIKANYYLFSAPNEPWFSLGNLLIGKNIKRFGKDRDHKFFWSRRMFENLIASKLKIIKTINHPFWTIILAKNYDDKNQS